MRSYTRPQLVTKQTFIRSCSSPAKPKPENLNRPADDSCTLRLKSRSESMATEAVKAIQENNGPEPNPKKALESTESPAALENPSADQVSVQPSRYGSRDSEPTSNEPVTDVQKKMKRAERFGMPVQLSEEEKRTSRAERFGSATNSNETKEVKSSEVQKRKARAERFGLAAETVSDEDAKKKARLARFAATSKVDNVEDDKRKARALRFSQPSTGAVSNVNVEGKPELNAAVAGNAGGAA